MAERLDKVDGWKVDETVPSTPAGWTLQNGCKVVVYRCGRDEQVDGLVCLCTPTYRHLLSVVQVPWRYDSVSEVNQLVKLGTQLNYALVRLSYVFARLGQVQLEVMAESRFWVQIWRPVSDQLLRRHQVDHDEVMVERDYVLARYGGPGGGCGGSVCTRNS